MKVSIIGTGNIGTDLLHKLLKIPNCQVIAFVGRRASTKQLPKDVPYFTNGIHFFIENPHSCDIVFDCTDASTATENAKVFASQNINVIDMTPSPIGKICVPFVNCDFLHGVNNVNMITCGGQVCIPLLKYIASKCSISYAEVVTQISSNSAGMATRINIDKYIHTTENAIQKLVGIQKNKVILNINPSPETVMQTTLFLKATKGHFDDFKDFIVMMQTYVKGYIPEIYPRYIDEDTLMVSIKVFGSEDYLSKYVGNLDIINCAAIQVAKKMMILKNTMKVSDIIVSFLINRGITTVFGIIGSANAHIFNSCHEKGIRIFNVHNEQAAVLAAGAYYRTCGKMALALVTAGGGVTNAITGVVSAWADSIPVIIISGQEKMEYVTNHSKRRMYGTQGFDVVDMVSKTTKYARLVGASDIHDELEYAYEAALQGRPGPVWLDIPFDVQSTKVHTRNWNPFQNKRVDPLSEDIERVLELIQNSKRPVILGGHGIKLSKSNELFESCVTSMNIPTLLTWSAIDLLDHENPLFFGSPGVYGQRSANFIFQKCDLIITIGTRLTIPQTGYDLKEVARNATIVMVDIDDSEMKEFVHVKIKADCSAFLEKISHVTSYCESWIQECKNIRHEFPIIEHHHQDDIFPNSYKMIGQISKHLKPDQIIVTDMGTALLSGHQSIRLKKNMTMFSSYGLGEMGYGLPAAFGAAIAGNGREVLCLNCDGGMMMNIQELQTIIQHKLRVKIIIFNNDGYLMIKHTQKMLFSGNYTAVDNNTGIVLPDYMKVADAFGYEKFRIQSWNEFDFYFPRFMDFEGSAICELFMPPGQDFLPKVKGVVQMDGSIFAPPIEEMSPVLPFETITRIMGDAISSKSSMIVRTFEQQ